MWQHPIGQSPVTWHLRQHRSAPVNDGQCRRPPVNAPGHRSTATDHGGDWRSTTVTGGEQPLTAAGPPLTTNGPPVNGVPTMTCHPPIRPAATCTHRSAPVNDGQRHRPTTVNDAGNRSTAADHGGDQRSTVAVNDGRGWRTTIDCRWTTVDHHRTTGQRCWGKARESEGTNSGNKEHKSGGDMLGMRRLKTSSENDEYEAFLDVWKQVLRENPTLIYNKHGHSLLKIKKRRFMFKEPLPPTVDTSRTESVAPCLHFVGQEEDQQARLEASCPPVASLTGKQSISLELEVSLSLVELLLKLSIKIVQTLIHTFTRPMSASWANNVIPRVTVEAIVALLAPVLKVQTKKSDLKPTEVVDIIV
nr:hypothetical protein [Tanacetum cinerariifolium]